MKSKNSKHNLLKFILILVFMFFICYKTINFLYKKNTITKNEYVKYLLSNSFESDIKINRFIKLMTNSFNPTNILDIPDIKNTSSDEYDYFVLKDKSSYFDFNISSVDNPIIYIYNTHQLENYKKDDLVYNITPNVMVASYILGNELNSLGIPTLIEKRKIPITDNWYKESRVFIEEAKNKYPSIKYYIDIHRDNVGEYESKTTIDNKEYARLLFVVGLDNPNYKYNLNIASKLSSMLNEKYPNISRGIITNSSKNKNGIYNQDISQNAMLIEFGSNNNDIYEVINTIKAFSTIFKEYIGE